MGDEKTSRRSFLTVGAAVAGTSLLTATCNNQTSNANSAASNKPGPAAKVPDAKEVSAVEDLMREHGVLRQALLVYSEAAIRLRKNAADLPVNALQQTAKLFRSFGEDYHEKQLEEAFIFPKIKAKGTGEAAKYPDLLIAQHARGRELTDHIISVTGAAKLGANATKFADTLDAFVRMYEHHAAREDTIIFPAWKDLLTSEEYDELNDKFEDIEHQQFGEDGFENAVKQIGQIEATLGIVDISKFTAAAVA